MSSEDAQQPRQGKALIAALVSGGLVVVVGLVLIFGGFFGGSGSAAARPNYGIYKDDRTMGNPEAPVVLIEYAAPTCPHCAQFFTHDFANLKREYIDTGKVFFVFRVFPLMPADGAVEAVARCLPEQRYFSFLEHMYRTQKQWDPEYGITAVRDALVKTVGQVGVSPAQFDKCLADPEVSKRLNNVAADGQTKYNIQGVPTFVINGKATLNPRGGWPKMKVLLDAALAGT